MANPLPNRSEELPDKRYYHPESADNWADILHDVLEELSAHSLVVGESRENYEPIEGQLFVSSDGNSWFLGDGDEWIPISISGAAPLDGGGTAILRDYDEVHPGRIPDASSANLIRNGDASTDLLLSFSDVVSRTTDDQHSGSHSFHIDADTVLREEPLTTLFPNSEGHPELFGEVPYTWSFWARNTTGEDLEVGWEGDGGWLTTTIESAGGNWQRYSVTDTYSGVEETFFSILDTAIDTARGDIYLDEISLYRSEVDFGYSPSPLDASGGNVTANALTVGETKGRASPNGRRPLISNEHRVVEVPTDYETIQEAVDNCPLYLRHDYEIRIDQTQAYDEHLEIPPVIATDATAEGAPNGLRLTRLGSSGRWEVKSIRVYSPVGAQAIQLAFPLITDVNPQDTDDAGIIVRGEGGEVTLYNPVFGDIRTNSGESNADAIIVDAGHVHLQGTVDFGTDIRRGVYCSHGGHLTSQATTLTGSAAEYGFAAHGSSDVRVETADQFTGNDSLISTAQGGTATINGRGKLYGVHSLPDIGVWGAVSDGELDTVLDLASPGQKIILAKSTEYTADRTISKKLVIEGMGAQNTQTSVITGDWTFDDSVHLLNCELDSSGSVTVNAQDCVISRCWASTNTDITINESRFRFINNRGCDLTFEDGAAPAIIDGCLQTGITDNTTDGVTIGTIADQR